MYIRQPLLARSDQAVRDQLSPLLYVLPRNAPPTNDYMTRLD